MHDVFFAGTGSLLPDRVLTNQELERMVDTSDEWIRERTGIERRHYAAEGETTVDMAEHAARRAIAAIHQLAQTPVWSLLTTRGRLHELVLEGEGRRRSARGEAELRVDVLEMPGDGVLADDEGRGDLAVAPARGDEP